MKDKSDDIKQFITDLYALRKESIAKDGEYGLGNLVFKEFRNRGYLDNLKDQRKVEKGKELSLETLEEGKVTWEQAVKNSYNHFVSDLGQKPTASEVLEDVVDNYDLDIDIKVELDDPIKYNKWLSQVQQDLNRFGLEFVEESLNEDMSDKVRKTTQGFKKDYGQIICNNGQQENEVVKLLKDNGYLVEVTPGKHGSVNIKYNKESVLKEELGSVFAESIPMTKEQFNKWVEENVDKYRLRDTHFGTLIFDRSNNRQVGTFLKLFDTVWCDDTTIFNHLEEVWTNGSGPGFYETIDYIRKEFEENEVPYEEFDDGEYTEFIVDETDKSLADMYISKWTMDYEWNEPDPTGKVSCRVPNEVLYWNR